MTSTVVPLSGPVLSPFPEALERERSRKRDEAAPGGGALAFSELAFSALADSVRDYTIFLIDPAGVITHWGEGARLMTWWTKAQAEGAHLRLLYPDGGAEDGTAEEHLRTAVACGEYSGEGQRVRSDGSTFWSAATLTALRDARGVLLGFTKVTRDLTASRAADAGRVAAAAAAQARLIADEALVARSRFLSTMSHEIRTPINAVLGYVALLEDGLGGAELSATQRGWLERLRLCGQHLATLVNDVLDLSRLEAGAVPIADVPVPIGAAIAGALALVEPQARARGIVLLNEASAVVALQACCGDEQRVRQVVLNLIANAVKFTEPRDGRPGRVTVSAGETHDAPPGAALKGAGPWVFVRVEDTGRGIAGDELGSIFEPFVQAAQGHAPGVVGSGLGLAISRRLARLMGGDLTVESTPGVGSVFVLWLHTA